jgi:hypothetical protein
MDCRIKSGNDEASSVPVAGLMKVIRMILVAVAAKAVKTIRARLRAALNVEVKP